MNNLQKMRKAAGLTQAKLAEKSGVNFRTLQHYELIANEELSNRKAIDVLRLCNAMGCTVSDLLQTTDARAYDERLSNPRIDKITAIV